MRIPPYYPARRGGVYRITRQHVAVDDERSRYVLRAFSVGADRQNGRGPSPAAEVAEEVDARDVLERLARRQALPTPEDTFDRLWQQLRLELDAR